MCISIYAHIEREAEVTIELRENKDCSYVTLETGGLTVFINDRKRLLEIASRLEKAAQQWEE